MKADSRPRNLFEYRDYKKYLGDRLIAESGSPRSGQRTAFSKAIGCQPAYLSRVLNADAHLSLEQAEAANRYLGHSAPEERFFFFLVLSNRAGTRSLREKMEDELQRLHDENLHLKARVPLRQPLTFERQATYYSAWYYTAIHMLLDIERSWTPRSIAEVLGLTLPQVQEVLSFLTRNGMLIVHPGGYKIGERETHVDAESVLAARHHINWRMRAIQSLEQRGRDRMHYSSVISVSRKAIPEIQEVMISAIAKIREIVKAGDPEEVLYSYGMDLFPVSEALK